MYLAKSLMDNIYVILLVMFHYLIPVVNNFIVTFKILPLFGNISQATIKNDLGLRSFRFNLKSNLI